MTAFASVMVFLLALMMFVTPSTHHGVGVDLPRANRPVNMRDANREDAVLVAIMRDGKVFFGDEHVTAEQLTDKIRERLSHHTERKVFIRADARARYGTVSAVLDDIRAAGILRIAILVDQRKVSPPPSASN